MNIRIISVLDVTPHKQPRFTLQSPPRHPPDGISGMRIRKTAELQAEPAWYIT